MTKRNERKKNKKQNQQKQQQLTRDVKSTKKKMFEKSNVNASVACGHI